MKILALCHTCQHKHVIDFDPQKGPASAFGDWQTKHAHHDIDFEWPERSGKTVVPEVGYLKYLSNADVKISYATTADVTITLASLATSSTLVTGREGTAISNASNKYLDFLISALVTTGTTPTTAKSIELWIVGAFGDAPTWPTPFDGTDSAETIIRNQLALSARLHSVAATSATSDEGNPFAPTSYASLFGGVPPIQWVPFVVHDTAVNLNSTGGNHYVRYTGLYATVV